jgi:hypothetical protein
MSAWVLINMGDVQLESGPFSAIQHEIGGGLTGLRGRRKYKVIVPVEFDPPKWMIRHRHVPYGPRFVSPDDVQVSIEGRE